VNSDHAPHEESLHRLAQLFFTARQRNKRVALRDVPVELRDADDAYRVQDEVAQALGWFERERPSVWKCGAPTREATPIAAPIPAALLARSPARFAHGSFHSIRIEAELAFRFRRAVDPDEVSVAAFDWADLIGETLVGIEIVDSRLDDERHASALQKLADFQSNGAYVIGSGVAYRSGVDWRSQRATVRIGGQVVAETLGGHPLGDPLHLLPWFIRHVHRRCGGVRAGDLVTLGTWAGMLPAKAGDRVDVVFDDIGQAVVDFD